MYPAPGYILGHYHVTFAVQSLRIAVRSEWTDPAPGCMSLRLRRSLSTCTYNRDIVYWRKACVLLVVSRAHQVSRSPTGTKGSFFRPFSIAFLLRGRYLHLGTQRSCMRASLYVASALLATRKLQALAQRLQLLLVSVA